MNSFKPPSTLNLEGNVAENWRKWKQRFQLYMEASGTMNKPEKQRVAIFLHLIGEEALEIYNTFSLSTAEQKIEVLFRKFEEYCNPRRNITFERHKFFTCVQESTENIDQYVTELRTKASTCEFGELCESLIRDRIVCGISSNTLREKLLQESDLSLQKAIDMCRASELSKRQTKSITEDPKSVDYVNKKASPGSKFPPKDRKERIASRRRNLDPKTVVKDVVQFMHRGNAQHLEKFVKNAKIETTLHLSVRRRVFISWKATKSPDVLSKKSNQTMNQRNYSSIKSRKTATSKTGKHLF